MTISPQRRNRIRQAHQLRQQGQTLRSIAQQLGVSHPTIIADLALLETDRVQLTRQIIYDLLLAHTLDLHDRVRTLAQRDPLETLLRFTAAKPDGQPTTLAAETGPAHIARLEAVHDRALNNALREFRLALRELDRANNSIKNQPADYPPDQLAAPDQPTCDLPTLTKPDHTQPPQPPAPQPTHDLPTLTKPDQTQPPQLPAPQPAPDLPTLTKPDHAQPPQPPAPQPAPDLPTLTKPDHAQPPQLPAPQPDHDLPTLTKPDHAQPPRPDTEPAQTNGASAADQTVTLEQLQTILETEPLQIDILHGLLQHPERLPDLPPHILELVQRIIADAIAIAEAHPAPT